MTEYPDDDLMDIIDIDDDTDTEEVQDQGDNSYLRERSIDWALTYAKINRRQGHTPDCVVDIARIFEKYIKVG